MASFETEANHDLKFKKTLHTLIKDASGSGSQSLAKMHGDQSTQESVTPAMEELARQRIFDKVREYRWIQYEGPPYEEPEPTPPRKTAYQLYRE